MGLGTGHGATITIGGTAVQACRQIDGHEITLPQVDASHLGTVGPARDYIPADLGDQAPQRIEVLFDTIDGPLTFSGSQSLVIALKQLEGETAPAQISGNGHLSRRKYPDLISNEIMVAEYDLTWDDEPSFTPATTT